MKTIWKFNLPVTSFVQIAMPDDAAILHVHSQNNMPAIWAMVDTDKPKVSRRFTIVGTGHEVPDQTHPLDYIGTVHVKSFVWHIFDCGVVTS